MLYVEPFCWTEEDTTKAREEGGLELHESMNKAMLNKNIWNLQDSGSDHLAIKSLIYIGNDIVHRVGGDISKGMTF